MVASIPGEGGLAGSGGWVLEQEDIELYLLVDRIGVGDGRKWELRGELGGVAAMACDGGIPGARAGARPGSRRCGADAERSEAAWDAKNRSGATSYGQRGERRHPCSSSARCERKEEEKDGARSIQAREWIRASRTEGEDRRDGRRVVSPAHRRSRDGLSYEHSNAQEENSNTFERF